MRLGFGIGNRCWNKRRIRTDGWVANGRTDEWIAKGRIRWGQTDICNKSCETCMFLHHILFLSFWNTYFTRLITSVRPSATHPSVRYLPEFLLDQHHITNNSILFFSKIDAVGKPSWQAQIKGTKQWILEPPPECYFKCKNPKHVVVVQPGDISKFYQFRLRLHYSGAK